MMKTSANNVSPFEEIEGVIYILGQLNETDCPDWPWMSPLRATAKLCHTTE